MGPGHRMNEQHSTWCILLDGNTGGGEQGAIASIAVTGGPSQSRPPVYRKSPKKAGYGMGMGMSVVMAGSCADPSATHSTA